MRRLAVSLSLSLVVLVILTLSASETVYTADDYAPIIVSAQISQAQLFPGTDGKRHVVYELMLTNATLKPVPLQKVEVVDGSNPSSILAIYESATLLSHLRKIANGASETAELEVNGSRLFLIDLNFEQNATPPTRLLHRLTVLATAPGAASDAPSPVTYTAAPVKVLTDVLKIGPPLSGTHWVAINGCCPAAGVHRSTGLPVNGGVHFAQRFAIDWMKLDDQGQIVHGDLADVHNYTDYGADIIAVADGTVTETLDALDDQIPPNLPDPKTINLQNVLGNHVVIDIGNGVYAFYAHIEKDSVKVAVGDRVKRGQVLGHLGNTGNTSGPHLHFHLMDGPSPLGSSGLPYVIDSFAVAGQISPAKYAAAPSIAGDWREGMLPTPSPRHDQFPMDLVIVNFGAK